MFESSGLDCLQYLALNLPKWPAWLVGLVHHEHPIFWRLLLRVQTLPEHGSVSSPTSTGLLRGLMTCGQTWRSVCTPHRQWMSMVLNVQPGSWYHGRIGRVPSARSHVTEIVWRQSLISWAEDGWSPERWTSSIRSCKDSKLIKRIQKLTRDVYEIHKMWKQEMQSQTNFTGAPLSASRSTLRLSAELCSHGPLRATHAHSLKSPTSKQVPLRAFGIDWWAAINGGVIHCHNPFPVPWKAPRDHWQWHANELSAGDHVLMWMFHILLDTLFL